MSLTYEEIQEALVSGNFSKLKDQFENEFLEVKSNPYDFNNSNKDNKFELCKDVTSFANSGGGFIVLGVVASKLNEKPHEIIEGVRGLDISQISSQTYIQHLQNGVYRNVESICSFHPSKLDGKDIFYIKIDQEIDNKPYLVRKNDQYMSYWIRTESHGLQESVEKIHETMRRGLDYENYLMGISRKVDELLETSRERRENLKSVSSTSELYKIMTEL